MDNLGNKCVWCDHTDKECLLVITQSGTFGNVLSGIKYDRSNADNQSGR